MSFGNMQNQMDWHVQQQYQQWLISSTEPMMHRRSVPTAFIPQNYFMQESSLDHLFAYQTVAAQPHPIHTLQRAHTSPNVDDWCLDVQSRQYNQDDSSSGQYTGREASAFDDVASCFSEAPSSYMSSNYTESPFGSVSPASRNPSVFSLPITEVQQGPTEVDALMMRIQPTSAPGSAIQVTSLSNSKRHLCPRSDCHKAFSQPTHLKIHLRSHTGEKPYTCSIQSCGQAFSQLGNLRTHERRHVGQRPNRRRATSEPSSCTEVKKYVCKLDGCRQAGDWEVGGKTFTQLGNLKAHMNKFHGDTLAKLSGWFSSTSASLYQNGVREDDEMTWEEREELRLYFQDLYKNSNKGIKGRGKGRKVEVLS